MSTRLVMLGLLKGQKLYGYELKHIIEEHMGDWTNIAFGSIYFALKKLTEENLVEIVASEKDGGRPSRKVYQITSLGKKEFYRLLEELWSTPSREYYEIDIALFFLNELDASKHLPNIEARIQGIEKSLKYVEEHGKTIMNNPSVPEEATLIFSHSEYHIKAELEWLRDVEKFLRKKTL